MNEEMGVPTVCKCISCGNIYLDEDNDNTELVRCEDERGSFWGCPSCETDENLMDLNHY
jgi:NAD-dependent SIR2 family protein deacetylase